jgi:hypothetical protein
MRSGNILAMAIMRINMVEEFNPNFIVMRARRFSTVFSLIPVTIEIALFVRPS